MFVDEHLPKCATVGRSFAASYPPVEAEDIEQICALFLCENADRLEGQDEGLIYAALRDRAAMYCKEERAARLHIDDQYFYRPDDVRRMLPPFFAGPEHWAAVPGPEDAKHTYDSGQVIYHDDRANGLSSMADISLVYAGLAERHRRVLYMRHFEMLDFSEIAEALELSESGRGSAAGKLESRAVEALCGLMNGSARDRAAQHDGPGARTAMSNAQAQALTRSYTDA